MLDRFSYFLVLTLGALANLLPVRVATWIACRFADLAFLFYFKRRQIALANVNKVFGDSLPPRRKQQIVLSSFKNIAKAIVELCTVRRAKQRAHERFTITGREHLENAFARGKGIVMPIAHFGSWEYLSFIPYFFERPCAVVVKNIKNRHVDKWVTDLRKVMTIEPIPKDHSLRTILKRIRQNHAVGILIDQWAGKEGLWTDFFGTPTSTTSLPVMLAKRTGCALVPGYCLRKAPGHYEIHIEPLFEWDENDPAWETKTTLRLNRLLESWIRAYPDQWLWGHRRWKEKPTGLHRSAWPIQEPA